MLYKCILTVMPTTPGPRKYVAGTVAEEMICVVSHAITGMAKFSVANDN